MIAFLSEERAVVAREVARAGFQKRGGVAPMPPIGCVGAGGACVALYGFTGWCVCWWCVGC